MTSRRPTIMKEGLNNNNNYSNGNGNDNKKQMDRVTTRDDDDDDDMNQNGGKKKKENQVDDQNGRSSSSSSSVVQYAYRPCTPAHHTIKESPLSSDAIFKQSHAGLFNLCIVVLVAVNSRLIIENLMKYGLLINTNFWFSSRSLRDWPLLMCCLSLPIFSLAAFVVEKFAWRKRISESAVVTLHLIITTSTILYPVFIILRFDSAVLSGVTLMLFACTNWLKLVSFVHTNYDMRLIVKAISKEEQKSGSSSTEYFYDVNFNSLAYFMVAPTLCYQISYPRTTYIRKGWVLRQTIKFIIFTGVMGFIIEQYINPIVRNSRHPLKGDFLYAIERVLKLSVPNLYVWLCMFYCFFHLWLNILAEVLRFGDREFYKDWWNAKTVEEVDLMSSFLPSSFSFKMVADLAFSAFVVLVLLLVLETVEYAIFLNLSKGHLTEGPVTRDVYFVPVHRWIVRHIYFPCIRSGIPKVLCPLSSISLMCGGALFISFFMSAVFHELCIAVPCHIFKFWAFLGIMLQVPLVMVTDFLHQKFQNSMVGNMMFWCFFCILGQPMSVLLYYHDLMNRKVNTTC
ncbi:hypothetical protein OSB04_015322 [Centaurea solstitialis]|uniref:O-acyltransferase n=1 Tax=Centaurea solstitialis TaxID=347529 RepID=A0AA38TH18_9ASTR|nr:hypothetical protein OSB04_015322 [Centaurea solstitialis]